MYTSAERLSTAVPAGNLPIQPQVYPLFSRRYAALFIALLCAISSLLMAAVLSLPDSKAVNPFAPYHRHPERYITDCPYFPTGLATDTPCTLATTPDFYGANLWWSANARRRITFFPRSLRYGDLLVLYGEPSGVRRGTSLYVITWPRLQAYVPITAAAPSVDARVRLVTLTLEEEGYRVALTPQPSEG